METTTKTQEGIASRCAGYVEGKERRNKHLHIFLQCSMFLVPALAPAHAPVPVASGRSEPSRAAMPTESSSSSNCSSDNTNSTDSFSDTSLEAPPKKKHKTKFTPAVCKSGQDLVQHLPSLGYQQYAEALAGGGFSSTAELSAATQKARVCYLRDMLCVCWLI